MTLRFDACRICGGDLGAYPVRGRCGGCYQRGTEAGLIDVVGPHPDFLEVDLTWMTDALCAEVDADLFFPEMGGSTREAKAVCAECLVRAECLDYALETGQRFGVWGGMSERERRRLLGLPDDSEEASAA